MRHHISRVVLSVALLSALACFDAATAADDAQPTLEQIVAQQTVLREQVLGARGAFRQMDRRERMALAERQQRVIDTLGGVSTLDALRVDVRTDVFNDLEWIKAAITRAEDGRKVCEYTATVGSHRREVVCTTAREQREYRERGKAQLLRSGVCDPREPNCVGD